MAKTRGESQGMVVLSLLLSIILFLPAFAAGATAPDVARLLTMTEQSFPARVAADSSGNIYVADAYKKSVRVYSSAGSPLREIPLGYEPIAVAISPDNLLYVGVKKCSGVGYLHIMSTSGVAVNTLTLDRPASIAFLSNGTKFVLDGYVVRKYDAAMNQTAQFGGYGLLPNPLALAVNEAKGELYVLDMGSTSLVGSYANTPVWRVQVFDLTGKLLRSFSNYGMDSVGKVASASGIAVDKAGRVYISDNSQPIVVAFDENGVALKTIFDTASPLYNIVNISFSNDRLYMSSMNGKFVTVYGVDGYANLTVTPAAVDMVYQAGMPVEKTLAVSNTGPGSLAWSASGDAVWLSVTPATGQTAGNASQDVALAIDPAKMPAGTYSGNISFRSNGGTTTVPVTVKVAAAPVLMVSPTSIAFKKVVGQAVNPVDLSIQIADDLTGAGTWHAEVDANAVSWLGVTKIDGINNMVPSPQVYIKEVPAGTYAGAITITSAGATGSPAVVNVSLEVVDATTISVTTNLANASFVINGPSTFNGTGNTSYTFTDAKPGTYSITFSPVAGYRTPASKTAVLTAGQAIAFAGNYVDLRSRVNIVASKSAGVSQPSEIAVFTGDGVAAKRITTLPYRLGATTAVGDVDGDGTADIIAGTGGASLPAIIKGMYSDGTPMPGLEFTAFLTKRGVNVAAADFDGDGSDEIIAADKENTFVKIYSYSRGAVANTGVYFEVSPRSSTGVRAAAADVDGDGVPELLITPERKDLNAVPTVNIYKIDASAGPGKWKAVLSSRFNACNSPSATMLAAGDVNGDGFNEILTLCSGALGSEVRILSSTGKMLRSWPAQTKTIDSIAVGDTTMDGSAEIIMGDGSGSNKKSVRIMDAATGRITKTFDAFSQSNGVEVSVGNLGY